MTSPLPSSSFFSSRESGTTVKRSLLLLPALALFAGCAVDAGTGTDDQVSTTTFSAPDRVIESTTVAPVAPAADPITGDQFAGMVISSVAADEGITIPESMAVEYAEIICTGLDDGLSLLTMVQIGVSEMPRYSQEEHAFLIGASVGALCPEFSYVFGGA